jgi:hypothetical protein
MSDPKKPYVESEKRNDGWWVIDPNNEPEHQESGPYATKDEARDTASSLYRFWLHCDEPGFITSAKRNRKMIDAPALAG